MKFSVLSYNTLFYSAIDEIPDLLSDHQPDIICLQEALTTEKSLQRIEKFGYKLADSANSFIRFNNIYGVATFYNQKTIEFNQSSTINLNTSLAEYLFYLLRVVLGYNQAKTILKTDFMHKKTKKRFSVCNIHLYVIGSNEQRINHLNYALKSVYLKKDSALIICGDFNYFPYNRKKLEKTMKRHGLIEATKKIRQTISVSGKGILDKFTGFQRLFIPLFNRYVAKHVKTDYVFYRGLKLVRSDRLEDRHSDHYPILSIFRI